MHIRYSEGQFFPLELWDPHYVKRFDTYPEAINYFNSRNRDYSIKRLTEKLFDDFPKAVKKECFQKIHDILFSYANQKAFAQSQPKLTKKVLRQKDEVQLGAHPFKKDDGFVHPNKKY